MTYLIDQPRRGNAGRNTVEATIKPTPDEQLWFNQFRIGLWPNCFPGSQFSCDPETLNQFFRTITPNTGPYDPTVLSDGVAALFAKIGPGILFTHSQGDGPGWLTVTKSANVKAIVAFEPGSSFLFPKGEMPPPRSRAPLTRWRGRQSRSTPSCRGKPPYGGCSEHWRASFHAVAQQSVRCCRGMVPANPAGRLPITFPRSLQQTPAADPSRYPGVNDTARYEEGLLVGYRWYDAKGEEPLFPFGYGLSYTRFGYTESSATSAGASTKIKVHVTNLASRDSDEVVQLYLQAPQSASEPPRVLKAFQRITLTAGTGRDVELDLPDDAFMVWDVASHDWRRVAGEWRVLVGSSSRDIRSETSISVQ